MPTTKGNKKILMKSFLTRFAQVFSCVLLWGDLYLTLPLSLCLSLWVSPRPGYTKKSATTQIHKIYDKNKHDTIDTTRETTIKEKNQNQNQMRRLFFFFLYIGNPKLIAQSKCAICILITRFGFELCKPALGASIWRCQIGWPR